jgi:hypothetical protein
VTSRKKGSIEAQECTPTAASKGRYSQDQHAARLNSGVARTKKPEMSLVFVAAGIEPRPQVVYRQFYILSHVI